MNELAWFFQAIGFLILVGLAGAVLLVALAVTAVVFSAWVVLEGARLAGEWVSARLRR